MRFFKLTSILLVTLPMVVSIAQAADTTIKDPKKFQLFDAEIRQLQTSKNIPGLAVAVVKDGELVWSQGYGYADIDRTVRITPDTPFWIASVTKTFVGLAFLHLEAEGRVNLNDAAAKTPGFIDLCQWLAGSTLPFGRDLRCDERITIRHILHHQVQGKPGSAFSYNPIMYSRLSRYLEHKFGQGVDAVEGRHNFLAQTIDRTILDKAGLTRTMSSQWDKSKSQVFFDMAEGFGIDEQGEWISRARPERHIAGGAGVVSTVLDLAKYDIAIDSGLIAPPTIKQKLFTPPELSDARLNAYATGWYVQEYRGEKLIWHAGWDEEAGFSALLLKVPNRSLTLILLANGEGLHWGNPLDSAAVEGSPFAQAFFKHFVFDIAK